MLARVWFLGDVWSSSATSHTDFISRTSLRLKPGFFFPPAQVRFDLRAVEQTSEMKGGIRGEEGDLPILLLISARKRMRWVRQREGCVSRILKQSTRGPHSCWHPFSPPPMFKGTEAAYITVYVYPHIYTYIQTHTKESRRRENTEETETGETEIETGGGRAPRTIVIN